MDLSMPKSCLADRLWDLAVQPGAVEEIHRNLGEACHEARNQLNILGVGLHLARQSDSGDRFDALTGAYRRLERLVEQFHAFCRPVRTMAITVPFGMVIAGRIDDWTKLFRDNGRRLEIVLPIGPGLTTIDPMQITSALDAFVSWRASASEGRGPAYCRWFADCGRMHLKWDEPGTSWIGGELDTGSLSEAMLARITANLGGESSLQRHPAYRVELRWPSGSEIPPG